MSTVITARNVSKTYKLYTDKTQTIKERAIFWKKNSYQKLQALSNINLNINQGSTVGLIGRNGSGKSTLLKLLSRIIYPEKGSIEIKGKVSTLLELGAGFHPDFTGRENIYLNASILGLTRHEIEERINDIISFSELEGFIDNPVKNYSTGMYMRLGFAIAINVDPDILLVDEVLAVGDSAFQNKCHEKIDNFRAQGKTIVLVTHDSSQAEKLCDYLVWLDNGVIIREGDPHDVAGSYLDHLSRLEEDQALLSHQNAEKVVEASNSDMLPAELSENNNVYPDPMEFTSSENQEEQEEEDGPKKDVMKPERWGNGNVIIKRTRMYDMNGKEKYVFQCGEPVNIEMHYEVKEKLKDLVFGIGIFRSDGLQCYGTNTFIDNCQKVSYPEKGIVTFTIEKMNLLHGKYFLDVAAHSREGLPYDYLKRHYSFNVRSHINDVGVARLEHQWEIKMYAYEDAVCE